MKWCHDFKKKVFKQITGYLMKSRSNFQKSWLFLNEKQVKIENVYKFLFSSSIAVFDAAVIILKQRQHMYVLHNRFKMKGKLGSF